MPTGLQQRGQAASQTVPTHGVRLDSVNHTYRDAHGASLTALENLSLQADSRQTLAVIGPSGAGKTTLLELICGLQQPDSGTVMCESAALMPQRDLLLPWLCALDNAALALRIAGVSRTHARERASALFGALGLDGFQRAGAHELSGGMRQRVAFLRTLLSGKPLLCLDEPFGALDAITRLQMQRWLIRALRQEPRTVVLVTHDVEEAILLADRLVVLSPRPGKVIEQLDIALPQPRSHTDPDVVALRERTLRALDIDTVGADR